MIKTLPVKTKGQPGGEAPKKPSFSSSIGRYVTIGIVTCVLLVFGVGGWAATAKLNSAVIASGTLVVSSNVKEVQHQEGGIVGEIYVKNGDQVQPGQLLVRLDETLVKANRTLLDAQLVALASRLARLKAQRDDMDDLPMPDELAERMDEPDVKEAVESQRRMLAARNETLEGQVNRLEERIGQLREQIDGHTAQREAKHREVALIKQELAVLEALFEKGHVPQNRIMALRREQARLEGEEGDLAARIAMAEGRINETQLEILQITKEDRERTFDEITQLVPELANIAERRAAADFQLSHMDIRAPEAGYIHEMSVHTVGGVIQPGETIMLVVPEEDQLVIEARVAPADVDQVVRGQEADVLLTSLSQRTSPKIHGTVSRVGADLSVDEQTGMSYYKITVTLPEEQLARLPEGTELVPGMPVEVYVKTGAQTVMAYLIKPLSDQINRVWRET